MVLVRQTEVPNVYVLKRAGVLVDQESPVEQVLGLDVYLN